MWTRRSPDEVADIERRKQRQRYNPVGALAITTGCMLVLLLVDTRRGSVLLAPRPFIFAFLISFLLLYLSHLLVGLYLPFGARFGPPTRLDRSKICPVCSHIHVTDSDVCSCGGRLEALDYWKHVDDQRDI